MRRIGAILDVNNTVPVLDDNIGYWMMVSDDG